MIRKALVAVCLLLGLATLVIGACSYRKEIVCRGREEGVTAEGNWLPVFAKEQSFLNLTTESRTSFVDGAFLHIWTSTDPGNVPAGGRRVNGVVFRWQQSPAVLFGSGSGTHLRIYRGILLNQFGLPLWAPFTLFLLYPSVAFVRGPLRRHRWRKRGLCPGCGYNTTGNTSGICPECGQPLPAAG